MASFADLLTPKSLSNMDKLKESLPKYNDKSNERFNEIKTVFQHNNITGVLLRADDRGNLYEINYCGEIYRPILIKSNIYLKNVHDNIILSLELFVSKIKAEFSIIQQNSPSVHDEGRQDPGN